MVDMDLNAMRKIVDGEWVTRVPGGWIYESVNADTTASVFVPLPAAVQHVKGVDY
jgi:hypothetical protein